MSKCAIHINNKHQSFMAENKEVLSEIMEDIKKMHKNAQTPEGFSTSVKKYLREIHEDKIKAEADEVLNVIKTESNFNRVMNLRAQGVPVEEAIRTFLTPGTHNKDNAGLSVASIMNKQTVKYTNMIEQSTTHAEKKLLASGALDEEIIMGLASGKTDDLSPTAQKMVEVFSKIYDMTHADKKNVGILMNKVDGYAFNQSVLHNTDKLRNMDPEVWIDQQMRDLDHDKTFPYIQTEEGKREYLRKVYDGILEREDESVVTNWQVLKEKDILKSSVQAKYAKARQLHYKPEGLVKQFKEFSDKSMVEVMISEIAKSARDTAIFDILGPRGTNALDTIVQKVSRELQKQKDPSFSAGKEYRKLKSELKKLKDSDAKPEKIEKMEAEVEAARLAHEESLKNLPDDVGKKALDDEIKRIEAMKNNYMKDINQITNANNKVKAKNRNNKAAWEMGRGFVNSLILGNVPLAAVTDLAWGVTAQQIASNRSYLHATGNMIKSIVETVPPERRKNIVTKMRIANESMLGHMLRVEGAEGFMENFSAKLNYMYSTVLPVQWQTKLHRTWSANILGVDVGEMTLKKWGDLNELEAQGFRKAGITENDWEALAQMRDALGPEYDNVHMVSSENIINISDEVALSAIAKHKANDPKFIPKTPDQYRAYLEKRYDAFIEDYMTTAVPMPGERARAFLHGSGEAGDNSHEMRKTLTMLKSFAVHQFALMQKVSRASTNKADRAKHMSGMVLGLIGMAYARDVIESLMTGEDLPDPTDAKVVQRAVLRSGAGTILADVLLQDAYGGKDTAVISTIAGPAGGKLNDAAGLAKKAAKGEFTSKDAKKLAKFIPGNNLMYFKLLNHHILEDAQAAFD